MSEPPFICDVRGCERPADWAFIGESGDLYLCELHATSDVPGWTRIDREASQ